MSLVSLVYVSLARPGLNEDDIKQILHTARTFNHANDITGMLLYRDGYFIQALEGETSRVEPLYAKISQDPRHTNVLLVFKTEIAERSFQKWSMGFNIITDEAIRALPEFTDFLEGGGQLAYFSDHPSRAVRLLESFRDQVYY